MSISEGVRMAIVLLNEVAGNESIVLLRQGFAIFPPFYEEIQKFLLIFANKMD